MKKYQMYYVKYMKPDSRLNTMWFRLCNFWTGKTIGTENWWARVWTREEVIPAEGTKGISEGWNFYTLIVVATDYMHLSKFIELTLKRVLWVQRKEEISTDHKSYVEHPAMAVRANYGWKSPGEGSCKVRPGIKVKMDNKELNGEDWPG